MAIWKQLLLSSGLVCALAAGLVFYAPESDFLKSLPYGEGLVSLGWGPASANVPDQRAGPKPGRAGKGRARSLPLVVLSDVEVTKSDERVRSVGTAQAVEKTVLYPEAAGRVSKVAAVAGQRINAGDIVLQLDDQVQRLAVQRAELTLVDAEALVQRYETLAARNTISAVQLTDANSALAKAKLDLAEAEDALERRSVRAPFSGEVGLIDVGTGDYITTSTPVGSLDERKILIIEFRIPERFANQIQLGQSIRLDTPALPGMSLTGEISGIDSRIDTASRTLMVQGTMLNDDDLARPGMSFEVGLEFIGTDHPSVPSLAVQWDRSGAYVWKVEGSKTVRSDIGIIGRQSDRVLVNGDLTVGDRVVSEGTDAAREGFAFRTPEGTPGAGRERAGLALREADRAGGEIDNRAAAAQATATE